MLLQLDVVSALLNIPGLSLPSYPETHRHRADGFGAARGLRSTGSRGPPGLIHKRTFVSTFRETQRPVGEAIGRKTGLLQTERAGFRHMGL